MSVSLCTLKEGMSYTKQLPATGLSQVQVLDMIKEYQTLSECWSLGTGQRWPRSRKEDLQQKPLSLIKGRLASEVLRTGLCVL